MNKKMMDGDSIQFYESLSEIMVLMKFLKEIIDSIPNLWFLMSKDLISKCHPTFQIPSFSEYLPLAAIPYLKWEHIKSGEEGFDPDNK